MTTKIRQNSKLKKKKKIHLFRISIPVGPIGVWNLKWKYVSTQNIWPCLWNSHNSMNLVLSFPCECIFPVAKFWGFMICCRVYLCFWVKVLHGIIGPYIKQSLLFYILVEKQWLDIACFNILIVLCILFFLSEIKLIVIYLKMHFMKA